MIGKLLPGRHGYKQSVALPYNVRQRDHLLLRIISHKKQKVNRKIKKYLTTIKLCDNLYIENLTSWMRRIFYN